MFLATNYNISPSVAEALIKDFIMVSVTAALKLSEVPSNMSPISSLNDLVAYLDKLYKALYRLVASPLVYPIEQAAEITYVIRDKSSLSAWCSLSS
nr:MAG TPA: hypothetical protein [Crassvirales sp.]